MELLKGKNVLFIAPKYFGYENDIRLKMQEYGAQVYYIVENIDLVNHIYSAFNKLPKEISKKIFTKYFIKKINDFKNVSFDFVFLIRGNLITEEVMIYLKKMNINSKFIMYQWDAIDNVKNILNLTDYFDKILTFDKNDYEKYGNNNMKWAFKPLFYIDDYQNINISKNEIDILFVGTQHSQRDKFLKKIKKSCEDNNINFYSYLYIPKMVYYKRKIFNPEYRELKFSDIKFKSMSKNELISLINRSKVIIDYQCDQQNGLTMRTIESLGAKKKLITTNKNIKEYDFYLNDNIQVISKEDLKFDLDINFISGGYKEINKYIYNKYSLGEWIQDIFR